MRLRCPACGQGPVSASRNRINRTCPNCGVVLQRADDADWLVTWINAYTVASVVLIAVIVVLHIYTEIGFWVQIAIAAAVATIVLIACYPNVKGASIAIVYFMRSRWRE